MYRPSTVPYQEHRGFRRTFTPGHLSLGLFFPLEAFDGDTPSMLNQVALAKRAEELGFCALWFRDVPLRDPGFGDVGQVFDPWVYLGYIAAHTSEITLGTASIAIPLHHPLHTAKASASVDQLSAGRLILGVASGDRPVEFSAFGVDAERRGEIFREHYEVIRRAHSTSGGYGLHVPLWLYCIIQDARGAVARRICHAMAHASGGVEVARWHGQRRYRCRFAGLSVGCCLWSRVPPCSRKIARTISTRSTAITGY